MSNSRKISLIILKLDPEKIFHLISWFTIMHILHKKNLSPRFIDWITASPWPSCTSSIMHNLLGSKVRGITQDDCLLHYLFIIVQQIISTLISNVVHRGKILPFNLKGIKIFHLIFTDDLLFAFRANPKFCSHVMKIFCILKTLPISVILSKFNISISWNTILLGPSIASALPLVLMREITLSSTSKPFFPLID